MNNKKKKWSTDTYSNVDEAWKHYAKWRILWQKTKHWMIQFIWEVQNRQTIDTKSRLLVTGD